MKKVLVFLLTLGLAAGAFAIDLGNGLTVAGEVKAGLAVRTADDGIDDTTDTRLRAWNQDAGQILRTRLTATYEGDWGGAKIRFQSTGFGGNFAPAFAYGWANFLDKKIVLYAGDMDGAATDLWGLGKLANIFDPAIDGVNGVRVEFKVVDGLSFGFALPLDQITYYSYEYPSTGVWDDTAHDWATVSEDFQEKTENRTLGAVFGGAVFGGLYKSDLFSAVAALRLYPAINSKEYGGAPDPTVPTDLKYAESSSYVDVIAGFEVNPIAPLKIVLDARFDTRKFDKDLLGWKNTIGYTRVGLRAQYDVTSQFNVHLQGTVFKPNESVDENGEIDGVSVTRARFGGGEPSNAFNSADYGNVEKLGDLALAPRIGVDYKATDTIGLSFQLGSDNILWIAGQELDGADPYLAGAGIYVKLGGKITLGTSSIEIFDKINKIGAVSDNSGAEDVSPITNQFQVDFVWKF
jgi:hypothetical protein